MSKKALFVAFLFIVLFGVNSSFGLFKTDFAENKQIISNFKDKGYSLFIPAGVTCDAILATDIDSKSAFLGQKINAILTEDFKYQDTIIAGKGSIVNGSIVVGKKNRKNTSSNLQVKFTTIKTPYNNIIPINGTIVENELIKDSKSDIDEEQDLQIESNNPITIIFNQPITLGVQ